MKKLIIALLLLFCTVQIGFAQFDTKTKNKIKVKYFAATDSFEKKNYSETIEKINEIEALTNGVKIPTALNLKIKSLVKLKKYSEAKKELSILEGLDLDDAIIKDMVGYSGVIEKEFKRARDAKLKAEEDARLAIIRKREKEKRDSIRKEEKRVAKIKADRLKAKKEKAAKIAKEKDEENWKIAKSENTVLSYKSYFNNPDNKKYKKIAEDKIVGIIWKRVIDADDIIAAAEQYLIDNPSGQNKSRAKKFIKYKDITSLTVSQYSDTSIYIQDQDGYLRDEKEVWKNLGYLVNLKSLHIKTLKASKTKDIYFYCLKNLEKLTLGKNIKASFKTIKNLVSLKEYTNPNKGISEFFKLKTLEKVDATVTDYQIEKLLSNNKGLTDLTLAFHGSMSPKNIDLFTSLDQLERLTFSNLSKYDYGLPNTIGNLKKLKYLSLNDLNENLPEEIGNLTRLETLLLKSANINTLPQSIGNLESLEELNLRIADITSLPESFVLLTNLKKLNVHTPKNDFTKDELWRNKDVRKVIKKLKKGNSNLNLITKE